MIANLFNTPVTENDFSIFSLSNADHHRNVMVALSSLVSLTTYPLDPMPENDIPSWNRRHQQSHNDINQFLGLNGVDLTDIDFSNTKELDAYILLHGDEHLMWAMKTGVF